MYACDGEKKKGGRGTTKWTTFFTIAHAHATFYWHEVAERIVCVCVRMVHLWNLCVYLFCFVQNYPPINIIGRFSIWARFSMPVKVDICEKSWWCRFKVFINQAHKRLRHHQTLAIKILQKIFGMLSSSRIFGDWRHVFNVDANILQIIVLSANWSKNATSIEVKLAYQHAVFVYAWRRLQSLPINRLQSNCSGWHPSTKSLCSQTNKPAKANRSSFKALRQSNVVIVSAYLEITVGRNT